MSESSTSNRSHSPRSPTVCVKSKRTPTPNVKSVPESLSLRLTTPLHEPSLSHRNNPARPVNENSLVTGRLATTPAVKAVASAEQVTLPPGSLALNLASPRSTYPNSIAAFGLSWLPKASFQPVSFKSSLQLGTPRAISSEQMSSSNLLLPMFTAPYHSAAAGNENPVNIIPAATVSHVTAPNSPPCLCCFMTSSVC